MLLKQYVIYKDVLLNKKCLRHSANRVQSKHYRKGIYEINKISLSCFDDKMYFLNNGYDGLVLGYWSYLRENNYSDNYLKQLFFRAIRAFSIEKLFLLLCFRSYIMFDSKNNPNN